MSDGLPVGTRPDTAATPAWRVLVVQELRDLWLSGRAPALLLAYTALLSVATYLTASNQELNFLEQREAVNLTLKLAVIAGSLLVLLSAADSVSGERDRGSLECLLLTPAPRTAVLGGKASSALSLWVAAAVLSLPYVWWIGRDVGAFGVAATGVVVVGSLLALFLTGLALLLSLVSSSNGQALGLGFFALLMLVAPGQLPAGATRGWAGELLLRLDPISAGLLYLERLILTNHSLTQDVSLLFAPAVSAALLPLVVVLGAGRLTLTSGSAS